MRSWIFQASPKTFHVDKFLDDGFKAFTWLVTKYTKEIGVGDRVYIWRASARENEKAGVIAEALVASPVAKIPSDEHGTGYWLDAEGSGRLANRVWLQLVRRGSTKEILRRDWLLEDPILRNMLILRQAAGTNFPLSEEEGERLAKMWSRVGQDWSRNESLAGLWAYVSTLGGEISKKPESPVSAVSRLTGRAITGVYNKVMNFRSIDPRDDRAGMSGGSKTDRAVWAEYFDAENQVLRVDAINSEFGRVWRDADLMTASKLDARALGEATEREAEKLGNTPLSELLDAYNKQKQMRPKPNKPTVRSASSMVYERNPLVIAIAKSRAFDRCEIPQCDHPTFLNKDGKPYTEVHHLVPLADGGEDTIENVACLCPAHHREAHLGKNSPILRSQLLQLRKGEKTDL